MFHNIQDLQDSIIRLFSGETMSDSYRITPSLSLPVRFFKKTSGGYSGEDEEDYPAMSIYFQPIQFNSLWYNDIFWKKVVGESYMSEGSLVAPILRDPFYVDLVVDVSTAVTSALDHYSIQNHFVKTFGKMGVLGIAQYEPYTVEGEGQLANFPTDYDIIHAEVPRMDGIHQNNFEISVHFWLSSGAVELSELIEEINIDLLTNFAE